MLRTEPPTKDKGKPPIPLKQVKKSLHPLLKPAGKQRDRAGMGSKLASALLGRKVDLRPDGKLWDRLTRSIIIEDGSAWSMVDPESGELAADMGPRRAANYAYILAKASSDTNHVIGTMGSGEAPDWQGGTALYKPSLRLDPNYAESMRRRTRKEARTRVKGMEAELPPEQRWAMDSGKNWRLGWKLLTLTFPHPAGMKTVQQLKVFNGAFRRLTKMDLWQRVWGGVKGVEDKLTAQSAHVHGHLLLLMKFTPRPVIRQAWKDALDAQVESMGLEPLEWKGDGLPSVDIRQVKENPGKRPEAVSWEIALDEVSKYITKTTDLLQPHPVTGAKVSAETLLELCDVRRWPRMFELLGKARSAAPTAKRAFLDTSCISAAGLPTSDVNGNQTGLESPLALRLERIEGFSWTSGDLDMTPIRSNFEPDEPEPPKERRRVDTWRELMDTERLESWCRIIDERAKKAQIFRIRQLKGTIPRLYLVDLTGKVIANQNLDID